MEHLATLSNSEIKSWLKKNGQPEFRAKQIFSWIFDKWVSSTDEMKNIPIDLRKNLNESFHYAESDVIDIENSGDMTKKILIGLTDSETVENVIIPADHRTTFCLSSQVGCPVQ